jgi:ribosome-binding factor A
MLSQLQRLHGAIQEDIAQKVILKYTPRIQFDMDHSIENGDKVLSLLAELDKAATTPANKSPELSEET